MGIRHLLPLALVLGLITACSSTAQAPATAPEGTPIASATRSAEAPATAAIITSDFRKDPCEVLTPSALKQYFPDQDLPPLPVRPKTPGTTRVSCDYGRPEVGDIVSLSFSNGAQPQVGRGWEGILANGPFGAGGVPCPDLTVRESTHLGAMAAGVTCGPGGEDFILALKNAADNRTAECLVTVPAAVESADRFCRDMFSAAAEIAD